jgi:hypothetical protein
VKIAEQLKRLTETSRGTGRLDPAPTRDALPVAVSQAFNSGAEPGTGGITSPLVEQEYAGETFYSWTSSDGLFVLEFGDTSTWIDDDGAGATYVFKHDDPST